VDVHVNSRINLFGSIHVSSLSRVEDDIAVVPFLDEITIFSDNNCGGRETSYIDSIVQESFYARTAVGVGVSERSNFAFLLKEMSKKINNGNFMGNPKWVKTVYDALLMDVGEVSNIIKSYGIDVAHIRFYDDMLKDLQVEGSEAEEFFVEILCLLKNAWGEQDICLVAGIDKQYLFFDSVFLKMEENSFSIQKLFDPHINYTICRDTNARGRNFRKDFFLSPSGWEKDKKKVMDKALLGVLDGIVYFDDTYRFCSFDAINIYDSNIVNDENEARTRVEWISLYASLVDNNIKVKTVVNNGDSVLNNIILN
jgi:hypothetical protein